jgi:hypothetical protein
MPGAGHQHARSVKLSARIEFIQALRRRGYQTHDPDLAAPQGCQAETWPARMASRSLGLMSRSSEKPPQMDQPAHEQFGQTRPKKNGMKLS